MPQTSNATPKHRWFRFSLRTLLIVVVLLSLPLGWFVRQAQRQRKAVEAIRKAGGLVWYDYELDEDGFSTGTEEPPTPAWLRELIGDDFFLDVVGVGVAEDTGVGDVVLEHVKGLTKLEYLVLGGSPITDDGLENAKGLTRLDGLVLLGTQVTDDGLEHLKGLTELEWLELSFTQVTDDGLVHLAGLERLKWLGLSRTDVTDRGLEHLKGLRELQQLELSGTQVTQQGIDELRKALPKCGIFMVVSEPKRKDQP